MADKGSEDVRTQIDLPLPSQAEAMEFSGSSVPRQDAQFPKFPDFPTEIRLNIWKNALPGPRVVRYDSFAVLTENDERARTNCYKMNRSANVLAKLALVCAESKDVVEKAYAKLPVGDSERNTDDLPLVIIDYDIDTLYIERCHNIKTSSRYSEIRARIFSGLGKVKFLAVSSKLLIEEQYFHQLYRSILKSLRHLVFITTRGIRPEEFLEDWDIVDFNLNQPSPAKWDTEKENRERYASLEAMQEIRRYGQLSIIYAKALYKKSLIGG